MVYYSNSNCSNIMKAAVVTAAVAVVVAAEGKDEAK